MQHSALLFLCKFLCLTLSHFHFGTFVMAVKVLLSRTGGSAHGVIGTKTNNFDYYLERKSLPSWDESQSVLANDMKLCLVASKSKIPETITFTRRTVHQATILRGRAENTPTTTTSTTTGKWTTARTALHNTNTAAGSL